MSRGLGIIERKALGVLESGKPMLVRDIAGTAEGVTSISQSTYHSYTRALRSLARKGIIADMGRGYQRGQRRYAMPAVAEAERNREETVFGRRERITRPLPPKPSSPPR